MKLFFETASQVCSFLSAVPVGFGAALCIDLGKNSGMLRLWIDLLLVTACGASLFWLVYVLQEESLRLYHLLGLVCGALIYLRGMGTVFRLVLDKWKKRFRRRNSCSENRN